MHAADRPVVEAGDAERAAVAHALATGCATPTGGCAGSPTPPARCRGSGAASAPPRRSASTRPTGRAAGASAVRRDPFWRFLPPAHAVVQRLGVDAFGMRVHVEVFVAEEPDHGLAEALGRGDREARRRRHRAQHRDTRNRSLLDELERQPAGHEQHLVREWKRPFEHRRTDQLVEGVVPADVFADFDEIARDREPRRRVQPAGLRRTDAGARPSGRAANAATDAATTGPSLTGAQRTSSSSSAALPQTPHAEVARNRRVAMSPAIGRRSRTVTTLYSCSPVVAEAVRDRVDVVGAFDESFGAAGSRPRARSRCPGVRIVTASGAGVLAGTVHAELERFFGDEPVRRRRVASGSTASTFTAVTGRRTGASLNLDARAPTAEFTNRCYVLTTRADAPDPRVCRCRRRCSQARPRASRARRRTCTDARTALNDVEPARAGRVEPVRPVARTQVLRSVSRRGITVPVPGHCASNARIGASTNGMSHARTSDGTRGAERVDAGEQRDERAPAGRRLARRAAARSTPGRPRSPDLRPRRARARPAPPASHPATRSTPCRCRFPSGCSSRRSGGRPAPRRRFASRHPARIEYPTTIHPVARRSSVTRL